MVRKTITLPPDVIEVGQVRAQAEGRKFANYVAWLIRRDVQRDASCLEGGRA